MKINSIYSCVAVPSGPQYEFCKNTLGSAHDALLMRFMKKRRLYFANKNKQKQTKTNIDVLPNVYPSFT